MPTYSIVVDPDPEGGYSVTVPALPGCVTQGDTTEECIVHAREAIELYLDDSVASDEPIREEKDHPQLLQVTVAAKPTRSRRGRASSRLSGGPAMRRHAPGR